MFIRKQLHQLLPKTTAFKRFTVIVADEVVSVVKDEVAAVEETSVEDEAVVDSAVMDIGDVDVVDQEVVKDLDVVMSRNPVS